MKHGPIALIDPQMPVIAIAPRDPWYEKMLSQVEQVKSRGGQVIAVATEGDQRLAGLADHVLWVPEIPWLLEPGGDGDPAADFGVPDRHAARVGCGSTAQPGEVGDSGIEHRCLGNLCHCYDVGAGFKPAPTAFVLQRWVSFIMMPMAPKRIAPCPPDGSRNKSYLIYHLYCWCWFWWGWDGISTATLDTHGTRSIN